MTSTPTPENTITVIESISFLASIASLILAVVAIWLSIVFYRMSIESSKTTTEAAKNIASSVIKLENLFDKLYSDTFSIMRDTVSDMRKHMWPTEDTEATKTILETEKKADEKINKLKNEIENKVSEILQKQQIASDIVPALRLDLGHIIDQAITSSRTAENEAREETIRKQIINIIRHLNEIQGKVVADDIVTILRRNFPIKRITAEIEQMKKEGILTTRPDDILPDTEILPPTNEKT